MRRARVRWGRADAALRSDETGTCEGGWLGASSLKSLQKGRTNAGSHPPERKRKRESLITG